VQNNNPRIQLIERLLSMSRQPCLQPANKYRISAARAGKTAPFNLMAYRFDLAQSLLKYQASLDIRSGL